MASYAHPEVLVSTEWLSARLSHPQSDPRVRIIEVDVDTSAYNEGHIPGAIAWSWKTDLSDPIRRDITPWYQFESLLIRSGIEPSSTIVIYGDSNNWFAAWAFWQLKIYGHEDVRLLNGGRKKWLAEAREITHHVPSYPKTRYPAPAQDYSIRAFLADALKAAHSKSAVLVDVRSPQEFSGEILAPPGLLETCQRGGHIPDARNIPWGKAANDDGTFKSYAELRALYAEEGVDGKKPVIAYCRIGERSSHTWFVLKYLLGYRDVRNYDGSWTEWGNLVGAPVERTVSTRAAA
jgi:thiosulfate/3-mercaptopyruvate sulfurtransferase